MSIRVHVGGQILPAENAKISVFDRGFFYGDSVFETVATAGGRLFALGAHLDRLQRSAALLGISCPPQAEIERAVTATVAAADNAESRVRIIISRGEGRGDLDPAAAGAPELIVIAGPRGGPTPQMYADGVGAVLVAVRRNDPRAQDPTVKSGNFLTNVMAMAEARRRGGPTVNEAILCGQDGGVAEGASSNVFLVAGGRLCTPGREAGILAGITRGHVIDVCRDQGIACEETAFLAVEDLRAADEIFLTSSVRGVLPVTALDGVAVGQGAPGPITRRLARAYLNLTLALTGAGSGGRPGDGLPRGGA